MKNKNESGIISLKHASKHDVFCLERSKTNFLGKKKRCLLSWAFKEPARPEKMKEEEGILRPNKVESIQSI